LILVGLLIAGWGIYTNTPSLFKIGLALVSLPLASILIVYYGMNIVVDNIERITPGTPVEGRLALVDFVLDSNDRFLPPITVEIRDTPPIGLRTVEYREVKAVIFPGAQLRVNYKIVARPGKRRFGDVTIRVSDILGLYNASIAFQPRGDQYLRSRPKIEEPELPSESAGLILSTATRVSEKHGLEFYSVREYLEGDDPRLIDWKATARLTTLIVKEMRQETASPTIILFAPGENGDEGDPGKTVFETLARLSAGIANLIASYNQLIGLISLVDEPVLVPPLLGPRGFSSVLDGLANTPPSSELPDNTASIVMEYLKKYVRTRPVFVVAAPDNIMDDIVRAVKPIISEHGIPILLLTYHEGKVKISWRRPH